MPRVRVRIHCPTRHEIETGRPLFLAGDAAVVATVAGVPIQLGDSTLEVEESVARALERGLALLDARHFGGRRLLTLSRQGA